MSAQRASRIQVAGCGALPLNVAGRRRYALWHDGCFRTIVTTAPIDLCPGKARRGFALCGALVMYLGCGTSATETAQSTGADAGVDQQAPASMPEDAFKVTRETLVVSGDKRTFLLSVPANYDGRKSYPLVYALHGDLQSGDLLRQEALFENASKHEAIVVYPDGNNATWDVYTPRAQNKDMAFVAAIRASLVSRFAIASNRIFMWGQSSGAFFTSQFACRSPGFLRAIGVQSGGAPYEPPANNAPQWPNGYAKCVENETPVPAIIFHGTDDQVVEFASGQFCAQYWAYVNGCTAAQSDVVPAPCKSFEGCAGGNRVVFCGIAGAGHALWQPGIAASWGFFSSYR